MVCPNKIHKKIRAVLVNIRKKLYICSSNYLIIPTGRADETKNMTGANPRYYLPCVYNKPIIHEFKNIISSHKYSLPGIFM